MSRRVLVRGPLAGNTRVGKRPPGLGGPRVGAIGLRGTRRPAPRTAHARGPLPRSHARGAPQPTHPPTPPERESGQGDAPRGSGDWPGAEAGYKQSFPPRPGGGGGPQDGQLSSAQLGLGKSESPARPAAALAAAARRKALPR